MKDTDKILEINSNHKLAEAWVCTSFKSVLQIIELGIVLFVIVLDALWSLFGLICLIFSLPCWPAEGWIYSLDGLLVSFWLMAIQIAMNIFDR